MMAATNDLVLSLEKQGTIKTILKIGYYTSKKETGTCR